MSNNWPPPEAHPAPQQQWLPPQGPPSPNPWDGQHGVPAWNAQPPTKTAGDRALEWTIPINRSGLAVAAGYVALLSFPILVAGPVGVLLGVLALRDLRRNPERLGRGRAWFAIVYGGLGTALLVYLLVSFLLR